MERARTSGLSLRGSGYDLSRSRSTKKLHVKALVKRRHETEEKHAATAVVGASGMVIVSTVDALMQELRRTIHSMFCKINPALGTYNWYDNCSRQAFQFFTTTNSITSEAFHQKVSRLGIRAPQSLVLELFGRIDQEDLGEISYATFARRVFLPEPFFSLDNPSTPSLGATPEAVDLVGARKSTMNGPRPLSARANGPPAISMEMTRRLGTATIAERGSRPSSPRSRDRNSSATMGASPTSHASGGPTGTVVPYELMTLDRLAKCILLKVEERVPPGGESWYERAFLFFSIHGGAISFSDFRGQLDQLQIQLSPSKARVLFNRFDTDGNELLDRTEFTAGFARIRELLTSSVGGYVLRSPPDDFSGSNKAGHSAMADEFEVEAGRHLSVKQVMAKLRDKLEQHTSKESDRFRQAFKIFSKSSGITPYEFNVAMGKLGFKLSEKQLQDLFDVFDFDKSGDLDLNEFVQGVMLDDYSTAFWSSTKFRQKMEDAQTARYNMAADSVRGSWTTKEIEQMLREKIEQRTSRSSDCFRQAFRIFKKVNGIQPDEFHRSLEGIGLTLSREQADILFSRFDKDGSGDIDLDEFIHGVLPPDYIGHQWVAAADEMHRIAAAQKKMDAMARKDHYMTEIDMANWGLDEIEKRIRDKIEQSTSKSSDIFRQAYRIFKKSSRIRMDEFRERLLALGFRLTNEQCEGLFQRYDVNHSGDIDLQEFCMRILPPDYTGNGDYWSHSERYRKEMRRQKVEYAKRSRNGLIMLPKFEEARRYTRGHYVARSFEDLKDDSSSIFHSDSSDSIQDESTRQKTGPPAPTPTKCLQPAVSITPTSPASLSPTRPMAPRTPRPPSASGARSLSPSRPPSGREGSSAAAVKSDILSASCPTPSPRKMRILSGDRSSKDGIADGPRSSSCVVSPPADSPSRPRPPSPRAISRASPRAARSPTKESSLARSPYKPAEANAEDAMEEYEDEEVLEEVVEELEAALEALQAQRDMRRDHKSKSHRHRRTRGVKDADLAVGSDAGDNDAMSVRAAESVSGESIRSTGPRGVGAAKYTPQRSQVLMLKRFMRLTGKGDDDGRGAKASPRRL